MKSLIVFAGLVCFAAAQTGLTTEQIQKRAEYKAICQPQTGASDPEIAKAAVNDWSSEDPDIKEYNLCYFELVGVMTRCGYFIKSVFIEHVPIGASRDAAPAIIDECVQQISGVSAAEFSWQFSRCYFVKNPHVLV